MAHRPYPNRDRALRQLARHAPPAAAVIQTAECLRPMLDSLAKLRADVQGIIVTSAGFAVGEYRMSTR